MTMHSIKKIIPLLLVLCFFQTARTQTGGSTVGITYFSIESIEPTSLSIRDNITIGPVINPITGEVDYLLDSLLVENGDSISFTLHYNDIGNPAEVKIYYDCNNDGILTPDELVYFNTITGNITAGFPFPSDSLQVTSKRFFVKLCQGGVVRTCLSFYSFSSGEPKLIVHTNHGGGLGPCCIPLVDSIRFDIINETMNAYFLDLIKVETDIPYTESYDYNGVGLPSHKIRAAEDVPFKATGILPNLYPPGTCGIITAEFTDVNSQKTICVSFTFKIGCCNIESKSYATGDQVPVYTNASDYIEIGDGIAIDSTQIVILKAENYIKINSDFHAKKGSLFHAFTEECIPPD